LLALPRAAKRARIPPSEVDAVARLHYHFAAPQTRGPSTETRMRTLKIMAHISLDGVIQSSGEDAFPYADWTAPYRTPAGLSEVLAAQGDRFDLLLGGAPTTCGRATGPRRRAARWRTA
jgi:hypothetical protein